MDGVWACARGTVSGRPGVGGSPRRQGDRRGAGGLVQRVGSGVPAPRRALASRAPPDAGRPHASPSPRHHGWGGRRTRQPLRGPLGSEVGRRQRAALTSPTPTPSRDDVARGMRAGSSGAGARVAKSKGVARGTRPNPRPSHPRHGDALSARGPGPAATREPGATSADPDPTQLRSRPWPTCSSWPVLAGPAPPRCSRSSRPTPRSRWASSATSGCTRATRSR